ncbi:MAG: trehalose-phosphatase [Chloroflexi bacterium HGW-Chloroflexi-5]|jgi:trehalose 6-phosphate phosphatase|nr:MAG: trehalose-phosphatase [Chloroflexi bacterium HGW-Chloroflexi-5]
MKNDLELLSKKTIEATHLRLFLDYDGTLAEFASSPDTILPDPELIALFQHLVETPGVLPVVISGRRLSHIQKLLPLPGLFLAGTYGLEMQLPNGQLRNSLNYDNVRPTIERLLPRWRKLIQNQPGFYLEDKGWSLALHGRYASQSELSLVIPAAQSVSQELLIHSSFRLSVNERFLEFAPITANKAVAVQWILKELTPENALSVYFGDDDKDEEGFLPVIESGGYAVRVTSELTHSIAQLQMADPSEVRLWLTNLIQSRSIFRN